MIEPHRLAAIVNSGASAAVCTVVATSGSTPRKAGASMVVIDDGSDVGAIEGTVGGGAIEHEIRRQAVEVMATLRPALRLFPGKIWAKGSSSLRAAFTARFKVWFTLTCVTSRRSYCCCRLVPSVERKR